MLNNQKLLNQIITKAIANNQVSHAYLLSGSNASPLLPAAQFIAKAIFFNSVSFDQDDINCIMIENNNHPDILTIDEKMKVETVEDLKKRFIYSKKSVYIINNIEQATPSALNKLLKFIEEPIDNLYAIFTTTNKSAVLPTILSRCQIINILPGTAEDIFKVLSPKGISQSDITILSSIYEDPLTIEEVANSKTYRDLVNFFQQYLLNINNIDLTHINIQRQLATYVKEKKDLYLLLGLLEIIYKDITLLNEPNYDIIFTYGDYSQVQVTSSADKLEAIIDLRRVVELNTASSLLLDKLFYQILR